MKIMRLRVRDILTIIVFKHIGTDINITKVQVRSEEYTNNCIESNLAFLRSIPNSVWYRAEKKRDLFAMIRHMGKPTAFMTLSANEIGWPDLLKLLHALAYEREDTADLIASELRFIDKVSLINNDAVTCATYFNKFVNINIAISQSKKFSPFEVYQYNNYPRQSTTKRGTTIDAVFSRYLLSVTSNTLLLHISVIIGQLYL